MTLTTQTILTFTSIAVYFIVLVHKAVLFLHVPCVRQYGVCGEFGWARFRVVCFLYKTNPNPRKIFAVGKSGQNATLNLIFLGLDWPWVEEFVGFMVMFICLLTKQNLVNRKHRNKYHG